MYITVKQLRNSELVMDSINELTEYTTVTEETDLTVYLEVFGVEVDSMDDEVDELIANFAANAIGDFSSYQHPRFHEFTENELRWQVGPATLVVRWTEYPDE